MKCDLLIQDCEKKEFKNKKYLNCDIISFDSNEFKVLDQSGKLIFKFLLSSTIFGVNEFFMYGHMHGDSFASKCHLKAFV